MRTMRIVVCLCLVPPLALLSGCGGSAPPPAQLPVVTIAAGVPGQTIHLCVGQSAELYLHPGVGVAYDCVMDPDDVLAFAYAGSPFNGGEGWAWTALKPGTVTVLVRYTVVQQQWRLVLDAYECMYGPAQAALHSYRVVEQQQH